MDWFVWWWKGGWYSRGWAILYGTEMSSRLYSEVSRVARVVVQLVVGRGIRRWLK